MEHLKFFEYMISNICKLTYIFILLLIIQMIFLISYIYINFLSSCIDWLILFIYFYCFDIYIFIFKLNYVVV